MRYFVIILLFLFSCSLETKDTDHGNSNFTDPKILIEKFNTLGIGKFGEWKDLTSMDMGYCSLTPYYEFGSPGKIMPNNISGYINSTKADKVENFEIVVNVNNPNEENDALELLNKTSLKALELSNIPCPDSLSFCILHKIPKSFEGNHKEISLIQDKSKIDTWKVSVTEK